MPLANGSAAVIVQKWAQDLIRNTYHDDLLYLARDLPNAVSLNVSMTTVNDPDVISSIYDYPDIAIEQLRLAAMEFLRDVALDPDGVEKLRVEITDVSDTELLRISHIRKEHVNKLVKLKCYVMGMTPTTPRLIVGAFKCQRCGEINYIPQERGKFTEPFECDSDACGRKGHFKLDERQSTQQDFQVLRLQERQEDIQGGEKPQTSRAEIIENHCGTVLHGSRVIIVAIVRERLKISAAGKSDQFNIILEVVSVAPDETESRIQVTKDDIQVLEAHTQRPEYTDWVVGSFAPSVYGLVEVKEALLLQMVSNGYKRNPRDGTIMRDFVHVALVGDPGVAKSSLKMAMKGYDPRVVLSSGTGATVAGLTAAVIKDDLTEGYTFEAGVLPLADGGGAILDEFDKMLPPEMKHLNDALDECRFTIHKASIHMELWSRCWMCAMLNPVDGKLDMNYGAPLHKQVGIPPDTLSRFDLTFIIPDVVEVKKDTKVGYAMLNARAIPHSGSNGNSPDSVNNLMPQKDIQKLIAHARTITPIFSREVGDELHRQWLLGREASGVDRVSVTSRYMGALVRLAKCEAQIHLSPVVTIYHLNRAVKVLMASLYQTCMDKNGNIDSGKMETGISKDMRGTIRTIREVIASCQKEGVPAGIGDIALAVEKFDITRSVLDSYLSHLKAEGSVYEVSEGRWRVP